VVVVATAVAAVAAAATVNLVGKPFWSFDVRRIR